MTGPNNYQLKAHTSGLDSLTPREKQILSLVSDGLQNKQIAAEMGISKQTVKNHLSNIFEKLGTRSRTSAAFTYYKSHPEAETREAQP